jgi:hypothetical protein
MSTRLYLSPPFARSHHNFFQYLAELDGIAITNLYGSNAQNSLVRARPGSVHPSENAVRKPTESECISLLQSEPKLKYIVTNKDTAKFNPRPRFPLNSENPIVNRRERGPHPYISV